MLTALECILSMQISLRTQLESIIYYLNCYPEIKQGASAGFAEDTPSVHSYYINTLILINLQN